MVCYISKHSLAAVWIWETGHKNLLTVCLMESSLTKKKEEQQLHGILGLAKYEGEQLDLLRSASESDRVAKR